MCQDIHDVTGSVCERDKTRLSNSQGDKYKIDVIHMTVIQG